MLLVSLEKRREQLDACFKLYYGFLRVDLQELPYV